MFLFSPVQNWQRLPNFSQWDVPGTVPPTSLLLRGGQCPNRAISCPFLLPATLAKPWVLWLSIAALSSGDDAKNPLPMLGMDTFSMRRRVGPAAPGTGSPCPMLCATGGDIRARVAFLDDFFFRLGDSQSIAFAQTPWGLMWGGCIHEGISPAWLCAPRDSLGWVWGGQHGLWGSRGLFLTAEAAADPGSSAWAGFSTSSSVTLAGPTHSIAGTPARSNRAWGLPRGTAVSPWS